MENSELILPSTKKRNKVHKEQQIIPKVSRRKGRKNPEKNRDN
jgi:hypothetical protein